MNWTSLELSKGSISKYQIKVIHTIKSKLAINEDEYREILNSYSVSSSKQLSFKEAKTLIDRLEASAVVKGVWQKRFKPKLVYSESCIIDGRPTPKMVRAISGLWNDISYIKDKSKKVTALDNFVKRITDASCVKELSFEDASKVITALRKMKK